MGYSSCGFVSVIFSKHNRKIFSQSWKREKSRQNGGRQTLQWFFNCEN